MIDISWNGDDTFAPALPAAKILALRLQLTVPAFPAGSGISLDTDQVKHLYGKDADHESILEGRHPAMSGASALYAALNRMAFFGNVLPPSTENAA